MKKQKDLSRFHKHLFHQVVSPGSGGKGEKEPREQAAPSNLAAGEQHSRDEEGRRRGEERRREDDKRERQQSSDRERRGWEGERRRSGDGRYSRESYSHERRRSGDDERSGRDRRDSSRSGTDTGGNDRRDSYWRQERTFEEPLKEVDIERTPSPLPPKETAREEEGVPSPPPQKKTKLEAGIEVEVEEVDPVERRKMAASKRATQESMMSAKERFLARKRARLEGERDKNDQ